METTENISFPGGINRPRKYGDFGHDAQTDPERLVWYFKTRDEAQTVSNTVPGTHVSEYARGLCVRFTQPINVAQSFLGRDGHPVWPSRKR